MISYRKAPLAAAPEHQLHCCVHCRARKKEQGTDISIVMMVWLHLLLDCKSMKRKGKEEKEDSCLAI